jgi:uncharacterized protein (DUF433 family)
MKRLALLDMPVPLHADSDDVLRVGNSRVTLASVIWAYLDGSSAEEIVEQFDSLTLADAHGVIAYYLIHRAEIDEYLMSREADANEFRVEAATRSEQGGRVSG